MNFARPFQNCNRYLSVLLLASIIPAVLCACTTKKTVQQTTTSSMEETKLLVKETHLLPVPQSTVKMNIGMESLRNLPSGASFTRKDGQANLDIKVQGDTIFVTATCDSLQREIERLYSELDRTRIRNDTEKVEVKKTISPIKIFSVGALVGLILAIILFVLIKIR